jgi:hypothetical protein
MITVESAQKYAKQLYEASIVLAKAIDAVKEMERLGYAAITAEETAAETVQIQGEEIVAALRAIALRLDRKTLVEVS